MNQLPGEAVAQTRSARTRREIHERQHRKPLCGGRRRFTIPRLAPVERWYVPALWEFNDKIVVAAFAPVIFCELGAEASRFHANDRVRSRIEGLRPIEHCQAESILLQIT